MDNNFDSYYNYIINFDITFQ